MENLQGDRACTVRATLKKRTRGLLVGERRWAAHTYVCRKEIFMFDLEKNDAYREPTKAEIRAERDVEYPGRPWPGEWEGPAAKRWEGFSFSTLASTIMATTV